jgi:hypothetical protein
MNALDTVLALLIGESFVLRGRTYSVAGFEGTTFREVDGVEVVEGLKVFNASGRLTRIKVKATDRVAVA